MVGTQNKLSGFGSISSIGSLSVCGKFAASVFPTFVKYMLKLFAMSVLSLQGTPLDVINVSVTVVFFSFFFQDFAYCFACFFPIISMHVKFFFEVIFLCNSDYVS